MFKTGQSGLDNNQLNPIALIIKTKLFPINIIHP
jgi:hypothetical protein